MNIEGKQFSKSRNWAIWVPDILERYQHDAIRYYIASTFPETSDSDFSWEGFLTRVNNELVAAWGNLVNRILGFAYKRYEGAVPKIDLNTLSDSDKALIAESEAAFDKISNLIERVRLRDALSETMGLVRDCNAYLTQYEPWKSIKTDPDAAARTVYTVLRVIDNLKILLAPFLPFSAQKLHEYLGYNGNLFGELKIVEYHEATRSHKALVYDATSAMGTWEKSTLQPGHPLREPQPLFVKLEPEIVEKERSYLGSPREERPITVE
jgi:methionyl-tRNA synthetase